MLRKIFFLLVLLVLGHVAKAQMAMSFDGSCAIVGQHFGHYQNGFGIQAEIYYYDQRRSLIYSLSMDMQRFEAKTDYVEKYKEAQHNVFDFKYKITAYSIPILLNAQYRFFDKKKIQPSLGIGLGFYSYTDKYKQEGQYTSNTDLFTQNAFGMYPQARFVFQFHSDFGVQLKSGYHYIFTHEPLSYVDIHLGLIYKI